MKPSPPSQKPAVPPREVPREGGEFETNRVKNWFLGLASLVFVFLLIVIAGIRTVISRLGNGYQEAAPARPLKQRLCSRLIDWILGTGIWVDDHIEATTHLRLFCEGILSRAWFLVYPGSDEEIEYALSGQIPPEHFSARQRVAWNDAQTARGLTDS